MKENTETKIINAVFSILIFAAGWIVGEEMSEKRHKIHPELVSKIRFEQQLMKAKVDLLQCQAEKVDAVIRERVRLTGKPNP